jgi:hypothetical protein
LETEVGELSVLAAWRCCRERQRLEQDTRASEEVITKLDTELVDQLQLPTREHLRLCLERTVVAAEEASKWKETEVHAQLHVKTRSYTHK